MLTTSHSTLVERTIMTTNRTDVPGSATQPTPTPTMASPSSGTTSDAVTSPDTPSSGTTVGAAAPSHGTPTGVAQSSSTPVADGTSSPGAAPSSGESANARRHAADARQSAADAPSSPGNATVSPSPSALDGPRFPPREGDGPAPALALDHVSYSYTKGGKLVVRDLSREFTYGVVTAITGPSGAGKTTVLSLLSGLTSPTKGRVLYRGEDLASLDRYRFRSHDIGVIFQSFNLLPALTVEENITLSMEASGKKFDRPKHEVVLELLERVRLSEDYAKERILHLSGGEQQRVAIARALSYNPGIILADEPTGNLDLATQDDIMAIFRSLAHDEGKCVIIVTHSPQVAQQSDEVFELAKLRRGQRTANRTGAAGGGNRGGAGGRGGATGTDNRMNAGSRARVAGTGNHAGTHR